MGDVEINWRQLLEGASVEECAAIVQQHPEALVQLVADLQVLESERDAARGAERIAREAGRGTHERVHSYETFLWNISRYLNGELNEQPTAPEGIPPAPLLIYGIRHLMERIQRVEEPTQKMVFMGRESPLERLTEVIYQAVESDDPLGTFRRHLSDLPTLPAEHQERLTSLELFLTEYGHQKALWKERQEQLQRAWETAGVIAEENEYLQERLKELQGGRSANGWEPQGYQPLVDGAIEAENARLRGEVKRLAGEQEASERRTVDAEQQYQAARAEYLGLQTEIATTRGDLGAVSEYSEQLKQFLRRGAQRLRESTKNLREERRLSAGLQERVEELTRKAERESGQYATVIQERNDAQQQVVDLTTQLGERTEEYQNAHRQRRLSEAEGRRLRETYQTIVQEGEELYRRIDELTAQLRVAAKEIGKYSGTDAEKTARIAELETQREERELDYALQEGEREQIRTIITERDAARGALQGQLDEVHYLEEKLEELTGRVGRYAAELRRIRKKHQTATEIVGDKEQRYRAAQQELEELHLDQVLAEGLRDSVREVTAERDFAQGAWHRVKGDYDKVKQRLHVQRQLGHSTQERVAALAVDFEKLAVTVRYGRQLCQKGVDEIERLRGEAAQATDHATELAAHYEGNVESFTRTLSELTEERDKVGQRLHIQRQVGRSVQGRLTTEAEELKMAGRYSQKELEEAERVRAENERTMTGLERTLEETTARLGEATSQLEVYERGMRGARVLTESLVATVSQPGREHSPLVVEVVEEPEEISPAVTEPVLDATMILSAEPIPKQNVPPVETAYLAKDQPAEERVPSVPLLRRTITYHPRTIIAGLGLIGALAAGSYGLYRFFTSESPIQQAPISQPLTPIQTAADLQRYKSALESAYLEGIHHREGRDAILQRLQETAQRHPLQNDALQPEYESQLTHMRRIVGITHK